MPWAALFVRPSGRLSENRGEPRNQERGNESQLAKGMRVLPKRMVPGGTVGRGLATMALPVELEHVQAAAARLQMAQVSRTPLMQSRWVDSQTGVSAHFKCEHLQMTGSFKVRGATNAVFSLDEAAARRGVVAHSSGNHGAGCAAAAAARQVPCAVIVPHTTPASKIENMKRYGADVILCEPTQRARTQTSEAEAVRRQATLVHPYDDVLVIAGQGTIGLELVEQVPHLDAVLVPTSGGGLITGIAAAIKALRPCCRIIACEPAGKRLQDSLAAGTRVLDPAVADAAIDTIADAIRTQPLGENPWTLAKALLDSTVLSVTDEEISAAIRISVVEMKQAVEPAGAVALAALLSPAFSAVRDAGIIDNGAWRPLRNVAAVICGGNVDPDVLCRILHGDIKS